MATINKNYSLFSVSLLFSLLLVSTSCKDKEPNSDPQPVTISSSPSANAEPAEGCPSGYIWNNSKGKCELEQPVTDAGNINPNLLVWNNAQAGFQALQNSSYRIKVTPGNVLYGKQFSKAEMYNNSTFVNETVIIGIVNQGNVHYTDYYDINGKLVGTLKGENVGGVNYFRKFTPNFTGYVGGTDFTVKRFVGRWAWCVAEIGKEMTDGSPLGSASTIACMVWGAWCAAFIGGACVAYGAG